MPAEQAAAAEVAKTTTPDSEATKTETPKTATEEIRASSFQFIADRIKAKSEAEKKEREDREKKPEPKPETKTKDNPKEEAKAEKKEEPKEKEEKPKDEPTAFRQRKQAKSDTKSVAQIAAQTAAEVVKQSQPKQTEKSQPSRPTELKLPEEFAEQAEVFAALAEKDPQKYGDKAAKRIDEQLNDFVAKRAEYEKTWKKANPGQEFDIEDDAHADFVDEHYPDISPKDIREAKKIAEDRRIDRRVQEQIAPVQREQKVKEVLQRVAPVMQKNAETLESAAVKAVLPEMVELLGKEAELKKANPSFARAYRETVPAFRQRAGLATALLSPGGDLLYDDKDRSHQQVLNDVSNVERIIIESGNTTREDGREYAPVTEFLNMSPAQQRNHWTVDLSLLLDVYQGVLTKDLRKNYDEYEEMVELRSGSRPKPVAKNEQEDDGEAGKNERNGHQNGHSSVASSGGATVRSGKAEVTGKESGIDMLVRRVTTRG